MFIECSQIFKDVHISDDSIIYVQRCSINLKEFKRYHHIQYVSLCFAMFSIVLYSRASVVLWNGALQGLHYMFYARDTSTFYKHTHTLYLVTCGHTCLRLSRSRVNFGTSQKRRSSRPLIVPGWCRFSSFCVGSVWYTVHFMKWDTSVWLASPCKLLTIKHFISIYSSS